MIYGNIDIKRNETIYHPIIVKALGILKNMDYSTNHNEYVIDDLNMFLHVITVNTKKMTDAFPEIHEKYVDLHLLIEGTERIYFSLILPDVLVKQNECDDHIFFEKFKQESYVDLHEGDFVILFPEDVHMAAIAVDEPVEIKKIILKIALSLFDGYQKKN